MTSQTRRRVLLVDDDPNLLTTMAAVLEDHYDVVTAMNGRAALEILTSGQHFDVVCTDYKMPFMNGVELLGAIAARDIVVGTVLVTGMRESRDMFASESAVTALLLKPCEPHDLLHAIERAAVFVAMRSAVGKATDASRRLAERRTRLGTRERS